MDLEKRRGTSAFTRLNFNKFLLAIHKEGSREREREDRDGDKKSLDAFKGPLANAEISQFKMEDNTSTNNTIL